MHAGLSNLANSLNLSDILGQIRPIQGRVLTSWRDDLECAITKIVLASVGYWSEDTLTDGIGVHNPRCSTKRW